MKEQTRGQVPAPGRVPVGPAQQGGTPGAGNTAAVEDLGNALAIPIEPRRALERAFGTSLAEIKLHRERAPLDAVNARSGAAMGTDIYVDPGLDITSGPGFEILAEEVGHALQPGGGAGVSRETDPAEVEAKSKARGAASGQVVGAPTASRSAAVHRDEASDPLVELRDEADDWAVDEDRCLGIIGRLSAAQRQEVVDDLGLCRNLAGAFDADQMWRFVRLCPFTIKWAVHWFVVAGVEGSISAARYGTLIAEASEANMADLRGWDEPWNAVLANAPNALPCRMQLEALRDGATLTPEAALAAVVGLAGGERDAVKADTRILGSLADLLSGPQMLTAMRALPATLQERVFWIDRTEDADALSSEDWRGLLFEAPPEQVTELMEIEGLWAVAAAGAGWVAIIQLQAFQADPAAVTRVVTSADNIAMLLPVVGSMAMLGLIGRSGDVPGATAALQAGGVMEDFVDGLPRGSGLGESGKSTLRSIFRAFAASGGSVDVLTHMVSVRFDTDFDTSGSLGWSGWRPTWTSASWTVPSLERAWTLLEQMPPGTVEGNDTLDSIIHDTQGSGSGFYRDGPIDDDVVVGMDEGNVDALGNYGGPLGTNIIAFNSVFRHEIGHAVDATIGASAPDGYASTQPHAGQWVQYGGMSEFADAIIEQGGGMSQYGEHAEAYESALRRCLDDDEDFATAIQALKDKWFGAISADTPVPAANVTGPVAAVFDLTRWKENNNPWYGEKEGVVGGRCFHQAYSGSSYYSFLAAARRAHKVSEYQWRAPGEWFAEVYNVYYSDYERSQTPGTALRGYDPQTADWFERVVDRGHSLARMTGQATGGGAGTTGGTGPAGGVGGAPSGGGAAGGATGSGMAH